MLDIRVIREAPEKFDEMLARRALPPQAESLIRLHDRHLACIGALQEARTERNSLSRMIGDSRSRTDTVVMEGLVEQVSSLKSVIREKEEEERCTERELKDLLARIPNIPCDDVPFGAGGADNVLLREWGSATVSSARQHFEIGEESGLMDFKRAAKLSGTRFSTMWGALARLERAIQGFMLDLHTTESGYTEVSVPVLVREESLFGTGQLPKFSDEQFCTREGLWLIPTAEVPLTNLVREQILDESALPMRLVAGTLCFRSEAGAAGRDTAGLIRQHQFSKVELVSVTTPEQSREELERICRSAEEVLKRLNLPYRVLELCSGDLGFSSCKTYDIEVWLPGQGAYREISSCSLCGDFQARRMQARFRPEGGGPLRYVHTLNGSGLAVGRTLVAILENYQEDGRVVIPEVLRSYMGGAEAIEFRR